MIAIYIVVYAVVANTVGRWALHNNAGFANTAVGLNAVMSNTSGWRNTAVGTGAGRGLTTGRDDIYLGFQIDAIGGGESNTIRIGSVQTRTFIAGIDGTAVSGATVVVNGIGQLGVAASSARFKNDIRSMDKASEAIPALRPVTFHYKEEIDPDGIPQFGLVAEEVEKVNPELVARDDQGKVYTVRYEGVNAMLLNEFLKEHKAVQEHGATIAELKKQIATLAARLDEQASQIQKVSAHLEVSKRAAQMVLNNQ